MRRSDGGARGALVVAVARTVPWRAVGAGAVVGLLVVGLPRLSGPLAAWLGLPLLRAAALVFALGLTFLLDDPARLPPPPYPPGVGSAAGCGSRWSLRSPRCGGRRHWPSSPHRPAPRSARSPWRPRRRPSSRWPPRRWRSAARTNRNPAPRWRPASSPSASSPRSSSPPAGICSSRWETRTGRRRTWDGPRSWQARPYWEQPAHRNPPTASERAWRRGGEGAGGGAAWHQCREGVGLAPGGECAGVGSGPGTGAARASGSGPRAGRTVSVPDRAWRRDR